MNGSEQEAQGEAGSCQQQRLVILHQIALARFNSYDDDYYKGIGGFVWS